VLSLGHFATTPGGREAAAMVRGVMPSIYAGNCDWLTDADWKTLLDLAKQPKPPDWLCPIIAPSGLSAPKLKPDK
jgi:hypothetical protein